MEKNVGSYDRIARFVAGPILLVMGAATLGGLLTLADGTLGTALGAIALVLGLVFLVTGLTQRCILNSLLGINTCPAK
ncbi:MAG: DUF2892 domain-containing protein [Halorientalis sp.]